MLDSTARAERIDLSSSEAVSYTWEVAQKPVSVQLPLALIDRLESEAVETFRSLTSRGSEIGGLLLGSVASGTPALVTVADFDLIPCDYSRGPLYRLSDLDMGRFEQAIEKYGSGSGARVVGYFRSHTRKGLLLDAEDLAFFEPRFLDPHHVVLLIRPFATKASSAGIFIRENGRLGEHSPLEFPFRSSELTGSRNGADRFEKTEPPVATAAPVPSTAPPAAVPKPPSRAQIVPIASRREITLPEPLAPAQPAPPVQAENLQTPPIPAQKPSAPPADIEKSSRPQTAALAESEKAVAAAPGVPAEVKTAAVPSVTVVPEVEPAKAETGKNKKVRLTVAAAIGMLVLVGGSLVVYPALKSKFFPRQTAAQQDTSPLSLRAERTSGGMLLTWDLHSVAIQNASKVMLAITDGERHENIQLDSNQVHTGSVLYTPISGDVSFQMEVTDAAHQSKVTSESLRVLDPRPSPLADPAESTAANTSKPATPAKSNSNATNTTEAAAIEETKQQEEPSSPKASATLRPFNAESLAQRLRPATPSDLPDAPAVQRAGNAGPLSLPGIVAGQAPPPPRPSAPASSAPPVSSTPAPVAGGQLVPAVVITRVDPEYPRLARQAGASGIVELEATIGIDGKVKNPHVLHGNTMLQKAALDAVLQWRYKPAMLNGKAVDSPVQIKLNFVAAHN